jgi:hypothetical protein
MALISVCMKPLQRGCSSGLPHNRRILVTCSYSEDSVPTISEINTRSMLAWAEIRRENLDQNTLIQV